MPDLIENTVVLHPETGEPVLLAAGGPLPDWATDLVGDHLLDGPARSSARSGKTSPAPSESPEDELVRLQARINALKAAIGDGGAESQDDGPNDNEQRDQDGPPPKSGPGSGDKAWRAYAADRGVEVPADAKREQVWSLLAEAGVPTE